MTTRRTRPTLATASCAAILAASLAACNQTEDPPDAVGPEPLGAIDRIYAELNEGWSIEDSRAEGLRREELIAECMAERGFEYTPVEPVIVDGQAQWEAMDLEPGTMEFAETYGYGYASRFWDSQVVDEEAAPDPNYERFAAMSSAEAEAYGTALWGEAMMDPLAGDAAGPENGGTALGCEAWAADRLDRSPSGLDPERWAPLDAEISAMYEAISSAPEQAELDAAWASCMTDAGYPGFHVPLDAENSALRAREAVRERAYAALPSPLTDDERRAAEDSTDDELADLLPVEIDLAVTDLTCREDVAYAATQEQIGIGIQQEFYDAHRDELDAWVEAFREARG